MKSLIKSVIGSLAGPLALALLLVLVGVIAHIRGYSRLARNVFVASFLVAFFGSLSWVGDAFLAPLEARFPVFDPAASEGGRIDAIVVLGSYYGPRDDRPVTAALDPDGLARIAEGVRLAMQYPDAQLLVTGGALFVGEAPAVGYSRFAKEFGIAASRIGLIADVFDTAQEARAVTARLGGKRFILVTSAGSMPRAMAFMVRYGARPIPAPTAHRTAGRLEIATWQDAILPSSYGLSKTEAAWHEYMGLTAIALGLD